MSRAPFQPTQEQRDLVRDLAAMGIPQDDICLVIKDTKGRAVTGKTLRKHFREELDTAELRANAKVAGSLFRYATDPKGGMKAVTAGIFWLKTRARWKETSSFEHTGLNGGPIETRALDAHVSLQQAAAVLKEGMRAVEKAAKGA